MDDKDLMVQKLRQEVARWKNRALEACSVTCMLCEAQSKAEDACRTCRIDRIKQEATK